MNDFVLDEGSILEVEFNATDFDTDTNPDGDNLIFSIHGAPPGSLFQQNATNTSTSPDTYKAYFHWDVGYDSAGDWTFEVRVRDEHHSNSTQINVTVLDVNRAPELQFVPDSFIYEFEDFERQFQANDPDGDPVTLTLEGNNTASGDPDGLPTGVHFAADPSGNGAMQWTPDCTQGNENPTHYGFWLNVTDGEYNKSRQFDILVFDVNAAPEIVPIPRIKILEDEERYWHIEAKDCDEGTLHLDFGIVNATFTGFGDERPVLPAILPNQDHGRDEATGNATWLDYINVTDEFPQGPLREPLVPGGHKFSNVSFSPNSQEGGLYTFYAQVNDTAGASDNITVEVLVSPFNDAPNLTVDDPFCDPANRTYCLAEGFNTTVNITALDPNGDDEFFWDLDWVRENGQSGTPDLPLGMKFHLGPQVEVAPFGNFTNNTTFLTQSVQIEWEPGFWQAGCYDMRLWVSDGAASYDNNTTFKLCVEETNRPPVFAPLPTFVVDEGEELIFHVSGNDGDFPQDNVELRGDLTQTPGAHFQDGHFESGGFNSTFKWTPGYNVAPYNSSVTLTVNFTAIDWPGYTKDFPQQCVDCTLETCNNVWEVENTWAKTYRPGLANNTTSWSGDYVTDPATGVIIEFNNTMTVNIVVVDVDRPPVWTDVPATQDVGSGDVVNLSATAYDPDLVIDPTHPPVTLTATGLPPSAVFTQVTDGTTSPLGFARGEIDYLVPTGENGTYVVTLSATDGLLTTNTTFTIIVNDAGEVEMVPDAPTAGPTVETSPNTPTTLYAVVTNGNPLASDTISFSIESPDGVTVLSTPASVGLGPGASTTVSFDVAADGVDASQYVVKLNAHSGLAPSRAGDYVKWRVDVPVVAQVTMTNTLPATGGITGLVTLTYLDGSPASGASIKLTQTPDTIPNPGLPQGEGVFTSSTSAVETTTSGSYEFAFASDDVGSQLPDSHTLFVDANVHERTWSFVEGYSVPT